MTLYGVGNSIGVNSTFMSGKNRVLSKEFNVPIDEINSGSKSNDPLISFSNLETGENVEIHRSDIYSEDTPIYILKGKTAEGEEFERKIHAWIINLRNCSYAELMVLNQEIGNTSAADKQRSDMLFEKTGVESYLDKADYSAVGKEVIDELRESENWDGYLSMNIWQQSINDYASVPVHFDRGIMGRNGISSTCSFAKVRSIEDIQKEWEESLNVGGNNKTSLREVLRNTYPNAENMLYGVVGSSKVMTFDEYVKDTEEMLRELFERTNK